MFVRRHPQLATVHLAQTCTHLIVEKLQLENWHLCISFYCFPHNGTLALMKKISSHYEYHTTTYVSI